MNSHTHTLPYIFTFTLALAACAPQGMPVPTLAPTRAATPVSALPAGQK
ncbi:MAG: hypothetical protein HY327_07045, partial [Chloroflexi bacterium]|nr:hypothetical protein [Chloroflexota bacterium]